VHWEPLGLVASCDAEAVARPPMGRARALEKVEAYYSLTGWQEVGYVSLKVQVWGASRAEAPDQKQAAAVAER